jgi:hypothetical protein
MRGEQRMIRLLLASVATATASEVLHGFQRHIEACDRARFDDKPAGLGQAIGMHRNPQDRPLLA